MTSHSGPLYEVTFFVAPELGEQLEHRIDEHVRRVFASPVVTDCSVFARDDDDRGWQRKVCLYTLTGDDVLDDFIEGTSAELEAQLRAEFGDQLELGFRILREEQVHDLDQ